MQWETTLLTQLAQGEAVLEANPVPWLTGGPGAAGAHRRAALSAVGAGGRAQQARGARGRPRQVPAAAGQPAGRPQG